MAWIIFRDPEGADELNANGLAASGGAKGAAAGAAPNDPTPNEGTAGWDGCDPKTKGVEEEGAAAGAPPKLNVVGRADEVIG